MVEIGAGEGGRESGADAAELENEAGRRYEHSAGAVVVAGMSAKDARVRPGVVNYGLKSQDLTNEEDKLTLYLSILCDS
jgi:hypothetical protein